MQQSKGWKRPAVLLVLPAFGGTGSLGSPPRQVLCPRGSTLAEKVCGTRRIREVERINNTVWQNDEIRRRMAERRCEGEAEVSRILKYRKTKGVVRRMM